MRRFITFVALTVGVLALFGLCATMLSSMSGPSSPPQASVPNAGTTSTTVTVEASNGAVAWGRLRWLLAGLSVSAVALVSVRQIAIAAAPKPSSIHPQTAYASSTGRSARAASYSLLGRQLPSANAHSHASIGD
jgi:hypothetical protein